MVIRQTRVKDQADLVFDALLKCMHRNFSDGEMEEAQAYILHKCVWHLTGDHAVANKTLLDLNMKKI